MVEWTLRWPVVTAYCSDCKGHFEIEKPTLNTHLYHCGHTRTRLPEKMYERWCDVRDMKPTNKRWPNDDRTFAEETKVKFL
jgi:hypothetical protein